MTYTTAVHFFDGYHEWREQAACIVSVVLADDLKALIPMGNAIDNMCKVHTERETRERDSGNMSTLHVRIFGRRHRYD